MKSSKLPAAILGIGLACVAAYLNVNGETSPLLWLGVFFCWMSALD